MRAQILAPDASANSQSQTITASQRCLATATVEIQIRVMQGVVGFSDRKSATNDLRQQIYAACNRTLLSQVIFPAESSGLSNHNTESVLH
jgi:hypothetical protein